MPCWVMVVENEKLVGRALARRIVRRVGVAVRLAESPEAASAQLTTDAAPVAIVLDGRLNGTLHGADALVAARRAGCRSPCAFWTSCGEDEIVRELERRGSDERPPVFDKLDMPMLLDWLRSQLPARQTSPSIGHPRPRPPR